MNPTLREQAAALPFLPGVYIFKNPEGEVLYVGKAIRLRERVRSYFAKDLAATRGISFVRMVEESIILDHELTGSEMEALLLEARLIRQYKPKYNIKLRDDKSFSLIRIDLSEPFPPIYISREKDLEELLARRNRARSGMDRISQRIDSQEFFGPYLSASSVKMALKTVRKIWPFRDCSQSKYTTYEALGHGCLFATLKLCNAPCAAKVEQEEYRANIDQIRAFLRGDREKVLRMVQGQMEQASLDERFEQAAKLRDRLQSLLHVQDVAETRRFLGSQRRSDAYQYDPNVDLRFECYDISNNQGSYSVGSQIVGIIRAGKTVAVTTKEDARSRFYLDKGRYRKYRIKTVEGASDVDSLREVLSRRFKRAEGGGEHWALPDLLLIDGGKAQLRVLLDVRAAFNQQEQVAAASVAKGPTRKRVDLYGSDWARFPTMNDESWGLVAELLREEAHRFAIAFYRNSHRKALISSSSILGVPPVQN